MHFSRHFFFWLFGFCLGFLCLVVAEIKWDKIVFLDDMKDCLFGIVSKKVLFPSAFFP